MTSIQNAFANALLADATYALNSNKIDGITGANLVNLAGFKDRMTPTLAKYIGDNFTVVTHIETGDVAGSGFDATVWRENSSGKLTVSMQGTNGLQDFLTDADLAVSGNARNQMVTMVNWWLKITTPNNQSAKQIQLETIYDNSNPSIVIGTRYVAAPSVLGSGLVSAADLAKGIEVNGHSLGGYLATAFTRLFGVQAHVTHTSTFNSAGFLSGSETVFQQLQNLVGPSNGLGRYPNASEQDNYFSGNGLNVTTNSFWFSQQGQRVNLYQEESTGVSNHYIYKLTDVLALGSALEKLDKNLTFDTLNSLINTGANKTSAGLEGVLDGVRKLVQGSGIKATVVGDSSDSAGSRVDFHTNLNALQTNTTFKNLAGKVTLSASAASAASAKSDFGQFLSLYDLAPFSMSVSDAGAKTALLNARSDVAAKWQNLSANFSDKWLQDRSEMQGWMLQANTADNQGVITGQPQSASAYYEDTGSNKTVKVGTASVAQMRNIKFGDDKANALTGSGLDDDLFGGAGNDTLTGNGGSDWLEGGVGVDVYEVGQGDVIQDSDGLGAIKFGETLLLGGTKRLSADRWEGASGELYTVSGSDIVITFQNEQVVIKNGWHGGTNPNLLGLALSGDVAVPDASTTHYAGTAFRDVWEWRKTQGGSFYETYGKETFVMGAGDDQVSSTAGGDVFYGEDGDDVFTSTEGDNFADGGNGNDVLADGFLLNYTLQSVYVPGQWVYDPFWGAIQTPGTWTTKYVAPNIFQREVTDATSHVLFHVLTGVQLRPTRSDDILVGGQGDDWLIGSAGNDVLDGGDGTDVVYGGVGSDDIEGGDGDDILSGDDSALVTTLADHGSDVIDGGAGNDKIFGNGGHDFVQAGAGNDIVWGDDEFMPLTYHGDDFVEGQEGNDTVYAGGGNDWIFGGKDDDVLIGDEGNDELWGEDGNDRLVGDLPQEVDAYKGQMFYATAADSILSILINDLKNGLVSTYHPDTSMARGADYLYGGKGDDTLWGGAGDDELVGGTGSDTYIFNRGDGFDVIAEDGEIAPSHDVLVLGAGLSSARTVFQRFEDDLVLDWGTDGTVLIADQFSSRSGAQIEQFIFSDQTIFTADMVQALLSDADLGGSDADTLIGSELDDAMIGLGGNDDLDGRAGNDTLWGGNGEDTLLGGEGRDKLVGGDGVDTASYADVVRAVGTLINPAMGVRVDLSQGSEQDLLQSNNFVGTSASVLAVGTKLADLDLTSMGFALQGSAVNTSGKAILINTSVSGQATLWAAGFDGTYTKAVQLQLLDSDQGVTVQALQAKYTKGDMTNGGFNFDKWGSMQSVATSAKGAGYGVASVLMGKWGDTVSEVENVTGSNYADQLTGNAGNNVLSSGLGNDTLTGGAGADKFVFNKALGANNIDTLMDFSATQGDQMVLDSSVFAKLAGLTSMTNHIRLTTQAAVGSDDYIVYNASNGQLLYDASGNGTGAAQLFATLVNKPQDIAAQQFVVI